MMKLMCLFNFIIYIEINIELEFDMNQQMYSRFLIKSLRVL